MWIRNDLALTLHHLKDDAGCLDVLAPIASIAEDPEITEPAYEDLLTRLSKATRTNLRLCQGTPAGTRD